MLKALTIALALVVPSPALAEWYIEYFPAGSGFGVFPTNGTYYLYPDTTSNPPSTARLYVQDYGWKFICWWPGCKASLPVTFPDLRPPTDYETFAWQVNSDPASATMPDQVKLSVKASTSWCLAQGD